MEFDSEIFIEWLKNKSLESAAFKSPYEKGIIHGMRMVLNEINSGNFDKNEIL